MYGFLFVYEDSAKRRYKRSLTDCLMLSIKRKGKKKMDRILKRKEYFSYFCQRKFLYKF